LLALLVVFVLALLTILASTGSWTPPRPPLPNPNGYDDFLKAAALLTGDVGNASALDRSGLAALVSTNSESLRLLRLGLSRQCALPADSAMTNTTGLLADLASLKRLAQLLAAEGRSREMDGRLAEATQSYLDAMRFGNEMSRGGFIINRLVGIACEAIGDTALAKLARDLSTEQARPVVAELEKIDRAGVTWEEVRRNENRFSQYQLGKGFNPMAWALARWGTWRSQQRAAMRHKRLVAHERLLAAELALRCYQFEQGHPPARLDDLVTNYLSRIPPDPFRGRPMIYRPQGTNWLLYSVGEDGADDGGKRVARSLSGTVTRGDLFYDSPY